MHTMMRTANRVLLEQPNAVTHATNETLDGLSFDSESSLPPIPTVFNDDGSFANSDINENSNSNAIVDLDSSFYTTRLLIAGSVSLLCILILVTLYRRFVADQSSLNEEQQLPEDHSKDSEDDDLEQGKVLQKVLSHDSTVAISTSGSADDDDLTASESTMSSSASAISTASSFPSPHSTASSNSMIITMTPSWPPPRTLDVESPETTTDLAPAPHRLYRMDSFVKSLQQDQMNRQRHKNGMPHDDDNDDEHEGGNHDHRSDDDSECDDDDTAHHRNNVANDDVIVDAGATFETPTLL